MHSLAFVGLRHVDEGELKQKLVTGKYFDPFAFQLDLRRIELYYRARGFFDARVVSTDIVAGKSANSVDIKINLDEGPATKLATVQLAGLDTLGDEARDIRAQFRIKRGQVFDHAFYLAQKDLIEERLNALGYAFADVQGHIVVDRDRRQATVALHVVAGPRAVFGPVEVHGLERVDARLLLRHGGLVPGTRFSLDTLTDARSKISNLHLFSMVKLDYHADAEHPEVADLVLTVNESTFRALRFGAGVSFDFERMEVRGRIVHTRRYFANGLRTLQLRLEPAYVTVPNFWQPVRHGPAATAEAELTQLDVIFPRDELKATAGYDLGLEYAFQYHGPRAQLGYSRTFLRDRLQVGLSYNFEQFFFFNTDPALLQDPLLASQAYGYVNPYRLGWWYEELALDFRDRALDARRGGYFAIRAEEGGVYAGGAFTYEKLSSEVRGYLPLGSRVVVAGRTEFGQIFAQGQYGSPITRRFYLGGPDTHRGFNYNRLSLQIPSGLPGSPALPVGGDEMFLTQVELRLKVVRLFGAWLELAGFVDAGDVAAPSGVRGDRLDLARLHYASGGGMRYKTLIGTVRADVGVRLNRTSATEPDGTPNPDPGSRVAFHLSIGEPF
ncbi:MAG: BamA/TamA family outer membrane protein [Myxococcales bacterium]|nr:BamA/TamA family outer membrane protein [Myxococcales bacterium]